MNLLTLEPKASHLNNLELLEPIDYDALELLLKSNLLKTYTTTDNKPYDGEKAHLLKYKKNYTKRFKSVKVNYVRSDLIEYGRVNPQYSLGLHCLKKQVRHTLCGKYLVDIDIVNAHPTILLNICEKYNYPCDKLKHYIKHRGAVLKEIQETHNVSRDKAKELVIILTYLGSYKKWIKDNELEGGKIQFLTDYHKEMSILGNIIKSLNPDLVERLDAIKNKKNVNSIMSYYLQTIECYILEEIFMYCRKKRIINKTCVLSNDGIMIPKEKYHDDLITKFEDVVKDKFDLDLKFETKPMDKGYDINDIVSSIQNETINFMGKTFQKLEFETGVRNELEAFEKVMSVYDDFKYVKGQVFGFDFETGLWEDGELVFKKVVAKMECFLHIRKWSEKNEDYFDSNDSYNNKIGRMKDLCSFFKDRMSHSAEFLDDDFFERNATSSQGCLLFSNGILKTNWNTKSLEFVDKFDKNIVFKSRINVDFSYPNEPTSRCDYEDIDEIKKLFFDIFGNQQDVFIEYIATAVFGLTLKKVAYVIGDTDAGKSTLLNFLKKSFSNDIIGGFDNKCFVDNKYSTNDASSNRWALLLKDKRLLISSESVNGRLNTELIKQIASGGKDELVGRFHSGNEIAFTPSFMMLTMLNNMPSFTNVDEALKNRLLILKLQKTYKTVVNDPTTEIKKITDDEMKEYNNETFRDAFRWVIIQAYENYINRGCQFEIDNKLKSYLDEVVDENVDDNSDDKIDILMDLFEFTGNTDDKVKSTDVISILEKHNSLSYLSRNNRERKYMFEKCAKYNGVKVGSGRYYVDNKQIRGFSGLKIKEDDYDDAI